MAYHRWSKTVSVRTPIRQLWQRASRREQRLLVLAGTVLLLSVLWWLGVAPAWRTLRAAPAQRAVLDAQLQQMRQWQAQAMTLRDQALLNPDEARRALLQTLKPLGGSAQWVVQAERVTVTLKQVAPQALAQLLADARQNARLKPLEAHLKRNALGSWDGSLVFQLPAPSDATR